MAAYSQTLRLHTLVEYMVKCLKLDLTLPALEVHLWFPPIEHNPASCDVGSHFVGRLKSAWFQELPIAKPSVSYGAAGERPDRLGVPCRLQGILHRLGTLI